MEVALSIDGWSIPWYKIDSTNFENNVVDLDIDVPLDDAAHLANVLRTPSFVNTGNCFQKFFSTIPDKEMWELGANRNDHESKVMTFP